MDRDQILNLRRTLLSGFEAIDRDTRAVSSETHVNLIR